MNKKAIIGAVLLVIICVCGYLAYSVSQKEYFCSPTGRMYKVFSNAKQTCEKYKDEPERYENCIKRFEKTKKAFKAGKCMEIIVETHKIDGSECKVTFSKDKRAYFSYSCKPRSPEVSKKIREMYGR